MDQITLKHLFHYRYKKKAGLAFYGMCYAVISFFLVKYQRVFIDAIQSDSTDLCKVTLSLGLMLLAYRFLEYVVKVKGAKESQYKINFIYEKVARMASRGSRPSSNVRAFLNGNIPYHARIMSHYFNEVLTSIWLVILPLVIYPFVVSSENSKIVLCAFILVVIFCSMMIWESFKLSKILKDFKGQDKLRSRELLHFIDNIFHNQGGKGFVKNLKALESESFLERYFKEKMIHQITKINIYSFFGPYFCICGVMSFLYLYEPNNFLKLEVIWASLFMLTSPMKYLPWLLILHLDMKSSIDEINGTLGKTQNESESEPKKSFNHRLKKRREPVFTTNSFSPLRSISLISIFILCPIAIRGLCNYFNYFVVMAIGQDSGSSIWIINCGLIFCIMVFWAWWIGISNTAITYQFNIHQGMIKQLYQSPKNSVQALSEESVLTCFNYHYQNVTKVLSSSFPEMLFIISGIVISLIEGYFHSFLFSLVIIVWMFLIVVIYYSSRSKTKNILDSTNTKLTEMNEKFSLAFLQNGNKHQMLIGLISKVDKFSNQMTKYNYFQALINLKILLINDVIFIFISLMIGTIFYSNGGEGLAFLSGLLALAGYFPRLIKLFFYSEEALSSKRFADRCFGPLLENVIHQTPIFRGSTL